MKGTKAVIRAVEFLRDKGFLTSDPRNENTNGHDIVAIKKGVGYTFEVKPAIYKTRAFRVSRVVNTRSDGILIVFPSGDVMVDSMKSHLRNCCKSGYRYVTFQAHVYDLGDTK